MTESIWYALAGAFALASAVCAWRVGPELLRVPGALWRGRSKGNTETVLWIGASMFGAAGAMLALDAVAVGGVGVLPWAWVFALLAGPILYAETILARTSPPGAAEEGVPGSVVGHVLRLPGRQSTAEWLDIAMCAVVLFALTQLHGELLQYTAGALSLQLGPPLVSALVTAAVVYVLARRAVTFPFGWFAGAGLLAVALPFLLTLGTHQDKIPGALRDSVSQMFAPDAMVVGASHFLPLVILWVGFASALSSRMTGSTAERGAALTTAPWLVAMAITLVGLSGWTSGAREERHHGTVAMSNISFVRADGTTPYDGYERVVSGVMRSPGLRVREARGVVERPSFLTTYGTPADFAVQIAHGSPVRLLEPEKGALHEVSLHKLFSNFRVDGEVLPQGMAYFAAAAGLPRAGMGAWLYWTSATLLLVLAALAIWIALAALPTERRFVSMDFKRFLLAASIGIGMAVPSELENTSRFLAGATFAYILPTIPLLFAVARFARPRV